MRKRVLFLDRDGTIIIEPPVTQQVDSFEKLEFIPQVITALASIARNTDFELVMVTNQDGLGTQAFPEESFWPAHTMMLRTLRNEGVVFSEVCIDRSVPDDKLPTRKPGTALLTRYFGDDYDLENSFVIGDRLSDVALAENLGCQAILFGEDTTSSAVLTTRSWAEIEGFLIGRARYAQCSRTTKETAIEISVALYGSGKTSVVTGLGFFDHMLTLLCAHAGFDAVIKAKGDLWVDEHHLIEDVGIVLGEAVSRALGDRAGISRYGFLLPFDEALSQVAIDLSGRAHLEWNASFRRERIGDMPTEMFKHFFKSFSDSLRCALHIEVSGENEHHKIEAVFKAVGRVLRNAVNRDRLSKGIPSTKGVL
jgi:imidazoleglycerol-phosphate dehydratase/histidinol-phosphatase